MIIDNNKSNQLEIKKDNPIELRNEEIEAILGRTPNSLVRNGIMVIFGVMILILGSTFFFSYPDSIHCRIIITSSNPPVHLIAQTSGHIQNLVVVNHQKVKTDQLLAILENPADVRDMLILETFIDSIKKNDIKPGCIHFEPQRLRLGDVLPYFLEFQKALAEFESFEELRYHPQKLEAMRHQIELTIAYRERLKGQLQLMEQDMAIEQKNYGRDSSLRQISVITQAEIDQSKSHLIQKKGSLIGAKINLENVQMQLNQLQISILDLQSEYHRSYWQLTDNISRSLDALSNQLDYWKKSHTFRSPNEGIVSFTKVWASNQFVTAGDLVMSILPLKEEKIIGKMEIPASGSGKIRIGQEVIIKLDNYPYMEFGIVKGVVSSISLVPVNDMYIAEITMPDGLRSNYGEVIPFNQEMNGDADIIIEDMSLFERFLQPVRSAIKRK